MNSGSTAAVFKWLTMWEKDGCSLVVTEDFCCGVQKTRTKGCGVIGRATQEPVGRCGPLAGPRRSLLQATVRRARVCNLWVGTCSRFFQVIFTRYPYSTQYDYVIREGSALVGWKLSSH